MSEAPQIINQYHALLPLPLTQTHVWYATPASINQERELALLYSVLSATEQTKYWRYFAARVRKEYCAAHALLRIALSHYYPIIPADWQFTYDPNGKPYISQPPDSELHFNLTHTTGLVACVISHQPQIGIDVENINREVGHQAIAERIFSRSELDEFIKVTNSNKSDFFFSIWTLKEAFTKAMGLGLSMPVQDISFHVDPGRVLFDCAEQLNIPREWQFALHDVGAHRLAIAKSGSTPLNIIYHELDLTNCDLS